MSTYTIRPTAVLGKDGGLEGTADSGSSWATASDVTAAGHLSDASDATGVRADADDMRWTQFDLAAPTIPGDEFIARVAGFLRWSHGTAGKYVGVQPYLSADGIPGYASTVIVDGRTTPTTTEPGYVARAWTTAEASALALQVQIQGDATPGNRPRLWEAGATLYALKQATATPQATTITGTTYPTIPVQVACTIDWEAGTPNWMGLRKVTVDVRVESGGTGVGTGTLVSSTQAEVWFTATGTLTANVALPDSLPNGTYKVYARATRHRENESAPAADQTSAWSSSATLTMTVNVPEPPLLAAASDDTLDRVVLAVTPQNRDYDAEQILAGAVLLLDARYHAGGQTIVNRGTSGAALNATLGSTGSADSNDPQELLWAGTPYVYLPGLPSNFLSVASIASIAASSDKFVWVDVELPDWTPAASASRLIGTRGGSTSGFELMLRSGGTLELQWRDSGTGAWRSRVSAALGFTDGTRHRVGASIDLDNGAGGVTCRFWESTDQGVTWTQIGSNETAATAAAIAAGTDPIEVGARNASNDNLVGKVYAAGVFNAIDSNGRPSGSPALTIDCSALTSGAATSFPATVGGTVTINRATSGRKSVAVVAPCWLLGTDDYIEIPDHPDLDFGATDSFTVLEVVRGFATMGNFTRLMSKKDASGAGWDFLTGTNPALQVDVNDGTNSNSRANVNLASGALSMVGFTVDRATQTLALLNGTTVGATTSISSVGSLANALAVRIGTRAGSAAQYSDFELTAVAVFRRALTPAELATLASYFAARAPLSDGYISPFVSVERSDDGGATWAPVRNATALAAQFSAPTEVIDYEAPRGVAVKYRARVSAYTSGVLNGSAPSAQAFASIAADTWNLKCPQAPALNFVGVTVTGEPTETPTEDVGVFRPLDRQYPVTVSGTIGGWDGDLEIACANTNEWSSLKSLIESQAVLLLESPFGWAKYIRLLPNTVKTRMRGSASLPRRLVTVSYVETSAPIGVAAVLPTEIDIIIDFGAAATASWDDILDGSAADGAFAGVADGGSAA